MDWQKQVDELIADNPGDAAHLDPSEYRRLSRMSGADPIVAESQIAETLHHLSESLAFWRAACAEVRSALEGAKALLTLDLLPRRQAADRLGFELARARYALHCARSTLRASEPLRVEYNAHGYDRDLWNGLEADVAALPAAISTLRESIRRLERID